MKEIQDSLFVIQTGIIFTIITLSLGLVESIFVNDNIGTSIIMLSPLMFIMGLLVGCLIVYRRNSKQEGKRMEGGEF